MNAQLSCNGLVSNLRLRFSKGSKYLRPERSSFSDAADFALAQGTAEI